MEHGKLINSEADFIVESPDYGVLFLEVKGGTGIQKDGSDWCLKDPVNGDRRLSQSPYKQAQKSMYYFVNSFSSRYHTSYSGIYGYGVVFPFFSIENNESIDHQQRECTVDSAELNNLHSAIKKMFRMWSGASYGKRLYQSSQHEAFLELVRERLAISAAAGALIKYKEKQLDVINRVQDNYVYFLKNIRKFYIRGGAGTGKTWIAMKMAICEAKKGRAVLFLCKSKNLADRVKQVVKEDVEVLDTNSFFEQTIDNYCDYKAPLYTGISNGIKSPSHVYDSIFVDEAQDFTEEWAALVRSMLSDSDESTLGVFYDDVQVLQEESFADGFGIDSPPYLLRENIRNTANIYTWVASQTKLGTDVIANPVEGPTPVSITVNEPGQLTQYLETFFRRYLDQEHLRNEALVLLIDDIESFLTVYSEGIAKWRFVHGYSESQDEISTFSVEEYKGLESDMVIYIHDKSATQNMNYIAYTRAKYYLIEIMRNY